MAIDIGWVDIGMLAFLVLSIGVGLLRGVVFELLSLAGWVVAYFAARGLTPIAQSHLPIGQPDSALNFGATFALVFLATLIVWGLAARLVRALIRATPISPIDRVLGAGFGLLRGVAVLLVVAFAVGLSPLAKAAPWQQSRGVVWLNAMLQELQPYFTPEVLKQASA